MHNYSVQNRYATKTKLGNWYEEAELNDYQFKQYLYKKNLNQNLALNNQSKLQYSNQQIQLSKNEDGKLHYGDKFMIMSCKTKGTLSYNIYQNILGQQTYATTTSQNKNPVLRNVFYIQPADQTISGPIVKYGDKVRFVSNCGQKRLYLQSLPASPMRSSKFSRHQEVSATVNRNSNTIWTFDPANPKIRFDAKEKQIYIEDQILIRHVVTSQWLASDTVNYVNQFGREFQVFGKSMYTNNKTQNLFAEKNGHLNIQSQMKSQGCQNHWIIIKGQ